MLREEGADFTDQWPGRGRREGLSKSDGRGQTGKSDREHSIECRFVLELWWKTGRMGCANRNEAPSVVLDPTATLGAERRRRV